LCYNHVVKYFNWNDEKNEQLKTERSVSFEDVILSIGKGGLLDIVEHPNPERYAGQRMFIVNINNYAFLVPFVEAQQEIFLKTIIPSRKATRQYLRSGKKMKKGELEKDEERLLTSYEDGEWHSVDSLAEQKSDYRKAARAMARKDRRVNIRISSKDLEDIQRRAFEDGLPYQTLISSVLHKFATGRLVERRTDS